jgi:hypothetical protein
MAKSPDELLRELQSAGIGDGSTAVAARAPAPSRRRLPERGAGLYLLVIAVLVAAVGTTPIGQVALYPFSLFATLIHEAGHALAAVATGGTVVNLRVNSDLSGQTQTADGIVPVVVSAGYVGTAIIGALTIAWPPRFARLLLFVLGLIPAAAVIFFHPGSLFTLVWCGVWAVALLLLALRLPASWALPVQLFLGLEVGLNAIRDVVTALVLSGNGSHVQTDADIMASSLVLSPLVWAGVWTLLSALVLFAAVWRVIRRALYSP